MTNASAILYENPAPHVARIVLNRPDSRNAQDLGVRHGADQIHHRASGLT